MYKIVKYNIILFIHFMGYYFIENLFDKIYNKIMFYETKNQNVTG